jgi:hypothetical protein
MYICLLLFLATSVICSVRNRQASDRYRTIVITYGLITQRELKMWSPMLRADGLVVPNTIAQVEDTAIGCKVEYEKEIIVQYALPAMTTHLNHL